MNNICVPLEAGTFNYRVGAILIRDNKLLMVKKEGLSHHYSIGGRVQFGESSQEALAREIKEELGITLEIGALAIVQESFYTYGKKNENCHELGLYYHILDDGKEPILRESFLEEDGLEFLVWLDMDRLETYEIYPEFFKTELIKQHQINHCIDDYNK